MPMPTMKTHGRLAALGALGVCGGTAAAFALFSWGVRPVAGGGLDFEHSLISIVSVAVICAALIAAHLAIALQLLAYAKENA